MNYPLQTIFIHICSHVCYVIIPCGWIYHWWLTYLTFMQQYQARPSWAQCCGFNCGITCGSGVTVSSWALTRCVKLRVAHAPGTSSPPSSSTETACKRSRHASRHVNGPWLCNVLAKLYLNWMVWQILDTLFRSVFGVSIIKIYNESVIISIRVLAVK